MYKKKRKVKKKVIFLGIGVILFIVLIIVAINLYAHFTSNEYKLEQIGYNEKEITDILELDNKYISYALENEYDNDLIPLTSEKWFIWDKYRNYKNYIKNLEEQPTTDKIDYEDVITKVNTKTNYKYYTHTTETNMDLGNAILVNKYYSLPEQYAPDDIVDVPTTYAFEGIQAKKEVYEAFKEMADAAKEDGITLIINSGYRTYEYQKNVYNQYESANGQEYADSYAARPDFSEHQSGLALDIVTYGMTMDNFEDSDTYKWLINNCTDYGFILRYPKGKEEITGYAYESWHYRYLGKELAKKVEKSGLTFDEYYAYYLDKE